MPRSAHERTLVQLVAARSLMDEVHELLVRAHRERDPLVRDRLLEDAEDLLVAGTAGPMCQSCGCSPLLECEGGCVAHESGRCSTCTGQQPRLFVLEGRVVDGT